MKKIAIITAGVLPVPPVKGGAVENLVYSFCKTNSVEKKYDLTIFSIDSKSIFVDDWKLNQSQFVIIKPFWLLSLFDRIIYLFALIFLRNKNTTIFKNLCNRYRYFLKLRKYLKKNDYDLVILENHFAEFISLRTNCLKQKYDKKVIYHSHNNPAHYKRFIKHASILKGFYSVSSALNERWKNVFKEYGLDEDLDFGVIKNGIDIKKFSSCSKGQSEEFVKKHNIPEAKKIILYPGRMTRQKGVFKLIETFKQLDESYHLLLVGDFFYNAKTKNSDTKLLKQEIESLKERVSHIGYVEYKDMPIVYSLAKVIVLPSIEFDSAPLTLIESICSCKPIIATDVGGIKEYSKNAGVVLINNDEYLVDSIIKSIKHISCDSSFEEKLIKMSKDAYKSFDEERYYSSFAKVIDKSIK